MPLSVIGPALLFETDMFCAGLKVPTPTLPKFRLDGETLKLSVAEEGTPVPVKVTTEGEFPAVLAIARVPVDAPSAVGANLTLSVILCPTFNVTGNE
jgi:hypothetical protein